MHAGLLMPSSTWYSKQPALQSTLSLLNLDIVPFQPREALENVLMDMWST